MNMTNDIDAMLETKKEWNKRKGPDRRQGERRQKDGDFEDRKNTADAIRRGRQIEKDSLKKSLWKKFLSWILPVILIVIIPTHSFAYTDEQAVKAIIGEAENQGEQGMIYVACAIVNRGTLKGVYGLHAPRVVYHKYSEVVLNEAQTAWALVHKEDGWKECVAVNGASNWENTTAFGLPGWASQMKVVLIYRDHKFFKKG